MTKQLVSYTTSYGLTCHAISVYYNGCYVSVDFAVPLLQSFEGHSGGEIHTLLPIKTPNFLYSLDKYTSTIVVRYNTLPKVSGNQPEPSGLRQIVG